MQQCLTTCEGRAEERIGLLCLVRLLLVWIFCYNGLVWDKFSLVLFHLHGFSSMLPHFIFCINKLIFCVLTGSSGQRWEQALHWSIDVVRFCLAHSFWCGFQYNILSYTSVKTVHSFFLIKCFNVGIDCNILHTIIETVKIIN